MQEPDYRLETLVDTFEMHFQAAIKSNEQYKKHMKDLDPNWQVPDGFDFCVSKALKVICQEILNLKRKL